MRAASSPQKQLMSKHRRKSSSAWVDRGITSELVQVITWSSSSHSQRMIILHSTFDRSGLGVLQKPSHPIYSLVAPLQSLSCLRLGRHANDPVNIALTPQPPTLQISHAHLLKWGAVTQAACHAAYCVSSFGDSTDISTKGWKREREMERVRNLCLAAFIHGIIRTTLAAFRGNHYKFYVHTNPYVEENNDFYISTPVLTQPGWKSLYIF